MCVAHCGRAKSNPNVLFRAVDYMEDDLTTNTTQPLKSETDLYLLTWKDGQNILFSEKKEVINSIFCFKQKCITLMFLYFYRHNIFPCASIL